MQTESRSWFCHSVTSCFILELCPCVSCVASQFLPSCDFLPPSVFFVPFPASLPLNASLVWVWSLCQILFYYCFSVLFLVFFLSWFWLFINCSSLIPRPARLLCVSAFRSSASIKTVTEGDQQISFLALLLNKWTCISISCLYLDRGHFSCS